MRTELLFLLNSDFGVPNTIGARALPILEEAQRKKYQTLVLARGTKGTHTHSVIAASLTGFLMKSLTAVHIYVSHKLPIERLKNRLFEHFVLREVKKLDLSKLRVVHSWDFLPNVYSYLKKQNPRIRIIQDVPVAFHTIIPTFDKDNLWQGIDTSVPANVQEGIKIVDHYIVPSSFVKKSLLLEKIPAKRITVVPFGVDAKRFLPVKKKSRPFRCAFAGNINERKGIKYLLQAWKELKLKDGELHLYGRVYPEAKKYVTGKEKYHIIVHGFSLMAVELPKNHLYVFPTMLEGSAKSVYEALASGLPVITTENAGSIVRDGKEGFIIPVQNVSKIKEKITYFLSHEKELQSFSKRARKRALEYSWERYAASVLNVYGGNK